ncbi:MAG: tetratricopeptide repeat protein [Candidatus Dormibacteraeota bacterium]|nr:tetratricopeptide repeat protein [Candidatus Dormibacteraeota bacterium]
MPATLTPLIGRDHELDSITELVRSHRVVTVTGPGGVGKTSVVLELARRLAPEFSRAVAFISFADVTDVADFIPALANALDIKESEERSPFDGLVALLGDESALLVLDNLEQIVAAAPEISRLVQRCRGVRVVTTSRTPLRISDEVDYVLSPLSLPPSSSVTSAETLLAYPAVALFVQRAQKVRSGFDLTDANCAAVAAVCRHLDGLPLAIELAAARLRLLSPEALLERLDHALDVLTSGARDAPARQQALRATIDWSYSLLTASEQRLFCRMAVFAGGCTVDDVEAVCAEPGTTSLDDLESVVDKALVQLDAKGSRLSMLQMIAEYARERLDASGDSAQVALRHAHHYANVVHEIRLGVEGSNQIGSMERGIVDEANIVAALDTLLMAATGGDTDACEAGMRICGDLIMYWHIRGKNLTARQYAQAFLDADTLAAPSVGRAGALLTAGLASWTLGQFERSTDECARAYAIAAEIKADRELCYARFLGAVGQIGFDLEQGLRWTSEAIARSRATGFTWAEGFALMIDGILQTVAGNATEARQQYEQALEIQQRIGDEEGAGLSLGGLAQLASMRGDIGGALDLYGRSLAAFQACGDRAEEARILSEMAWAHLQNGGSASARDLFFDSVQAYTDIASVRGVGLSLIGLAATESVEGRPENAVRIAAAAEVYANQEGIVNVYSDDTPGRSVVDEARAALSSDQLARATAEGAKLTIKDALALASVAEVSP